MIIPARLEKNALSMNEEEHSSSGEGVAMVFVELQNTLAE